MQKQLSKIYDSFLIIFYSWQEIVLPSKCLGCSDFFAKPEIKFNIFETTKEKILSDSEQEYFEKIMSYFLCQSCMSDFSPVESPNSCYFSGETQYFNTAKSFGLYDGTLLSLIRLYKYKGKIQLAKPLGCLIFFIYLKFFSDKTIDIIMPVPLHKNRLRNRGFNQAYLLIKFWDSFSKNLKIKIPVIERSILLRTKKTIPQVGLNRKQRISNIKDAFFVNDSSKIKGKCVLIIDDVYTTGSTVNECAKTLKKNGADKVDIITIARAYNG